MVALQWCSVTVSVLGSLVILIRISIFVLLAKRRAIERHTKGPPGDESTMALHWIIIVATAGSPAMLERCLKSILAASSNLTIQIVVVSDQPAVPDAAADLAVVRNLRPEEQLRVAFLPAALLKGRRSGKAHALNLALALQGHTALGQPSNGLTEWPLPSDSIEEADVLLCVDVDEQLATDGLERLDSARRLRSQPLAIQAAKHDASPFGMAFAASYDSWFWWEAGTSTVGRPTTSSYYGSMAAIWLRHSQSEPPSPIPQFRAEFAVEDFPSYVLDFPAGSVELLDASIASGAAPIDYWSHVALWRRWTAGNLPLGPAYVAKAWRARREGQSVLSALHHATTWYVIPLAALVPAALALTDPTSRTGLVAYWIGCTAIGAEWLRQLVPCPQSGLWRRLIRLPCESLLWPAFTEAALALLGPVRSRRLALAATPRSVSRVSPPVVGLLVCQTLVVLAGVARCLHQPSTVPLAIVFMPTLVGAGALLADLCWRRLRDLAGP